MNQIERVLNEVERLRNSRDFDLNDRFDQGVVDTLHSIKKFIKSMKEESVINSSLKNTDDYKTDKQLLQKNRLPKWKRHKKGSCWSGEIGVDPDKRVYEYEHYTINADKLFRLLEKED